MLENVLGVGQAPTLQPLCREELVGAVVGVLAGRGSLDLCRNLEMLPGALDL